MVSHTKKVSQRRRKSIKSRANKRRGGMNLFGFGSEKRSAGEGEEATEPTAEATAEPTAEATEATAEATEATEAKKPYPLKHQDATVGTDKGKGMFGFLSSKPDETAEDEPADETKPEADDEAEPEDDKPESGGFLKNFGIGGKKRKGRKSSKKTKKSKRKSKKSKRKSSKKKRGRK